MRGKKILNWGLTATLICVTSVFTACSSDDKSAPDTTALTEWQAGKTVSAEAVEVYGGIDINTLYNPYFKVREDGSLFIQPATAGAYCERTLDFPYKIDHNDLCFKLFTEAGFDWGGDWVTRKDYQHFELIE